MGVLMTEVKMTHLKRESIRGSPFQIAVLVSSSWIMGSHYIRINALLFNHLNAMAQRTSIKFMA